MLSELRPRSVARLDRALAAVVLGVVAASVVVTAGGCGARDDVELAPPSGAPAHDVVAFGAPPISADAPGDPPGEPCRDVGSVRACWGAAGPHLVAAARVPEPAPPDAAWRCDEGPRRCTLVRRAPFECAAGTCTQAFARLPDDADWECADVGGVVVCRDRAPVAGAVPGPPEAGWICGETRPRVCVDLAPDRPGAGRSTCRYEHEPVPARICRDTAEARIGAPCRDGERCPEGASCVEGTCVPDALTAPDCWTSADCAEGESCVLAHCASR